MAALRRAQQVAAQDVQALDVLLVERHAEHAVLELLHLLVHGAHDRRVVVDDEVEDGVQDVVLAVGQHRRAGFAARTHGGIGGGGAVAHGHDVAAADEDVRLAESDAAVEKLRGARDDEDAVAVELDLRMVVRLAGVLDGEVVQAELGLDAIEELVGRLMQPDPDHVARLRGPLVRFLDADVAHPAAAAIDACRHEAGLGHCGELGRWHIGLALRLGIRASIVEGGGFEGHGTGLWQGWLAGRHNGLAQGDAYTKLLMSVLRLVEGEGFAVTGCSWRRGRGGGRGRSPSRRGSSRSRSDRRCE